MGVSIDGFNNQVIVNGNMSALIDSTPIYIPRQSGVSAELTWTGTSPVGKLSLQCSNDGENFAEVGNAGVTGNTGVALINFEICVFYWVKIQYVPISGGTGTAQGRVTVKSIST